MTFYKMMELLINIISAVIAVNFISDYFKQKFKGYKRIIFFSITIIIYFISISILNRYTMFEGISGIVYSLILFIYALTALEGRWFEKMIISVIWNIVLLITSFGTFSVLRMIFDKEIIDILNTYDFIKVYSVIAATILKYIFARLIVLFKKKDTLYLNKQESIAMICIFCLLYIMVIAFFSIEIDVSSTNIKRHYTVTLLLCGFIGIVIGIYYFFRKLGAYNEIKRQKEYLQTYIYNQERYLKDITRMNEEFRIFRHDMKAHFTNIYCMIQQGSSGEAMQYLEGLDDKLKNYALMGEFTDYKGINAVLTKIIQDCNYRKINFEYHISGNIKGIEEMELAILLTNLLNNAIEACVKVENKRRIHLFIQNNKNYLEVLLSNTIEPNAIKKNPNLETTKKDRTKHGYGLKSVKQIVEKYDGIYQYKEENGKFIQEVYLKQSIY